jgi:hypothetical protein
VDLALKLNRRVVFLCEGTGQKSIDGLSFVSMTESVRSLQLLLSNR